MSRSALPASMHRIAAGRSNLPLNTVMWCRAKWLARGYELPPLEHPEAASEFPETGMLGLGDLIAAGTTVLGMKPCEGCRKRQQRLNELVPFKRKDAYGTAKDET